ncbi:MAG: phage portal protein [Oscillospiraceae bacterium]|nr:phage portal protein [Oscillospiraceae bacterium]
MIALNLKQFLRKTTPAPAVQTAEKQTNREAWQEFASPIGADYELYGAMRQAVPVIDAALDKIVRLTGDFKVLCGDSFVQEELDGFVRGVRVGTGGFGLRQFIAVHLDSMLTYGNAVGEIILDGEAKDIAALYNAGLRDIRIRQGDTPLEAQVAVRSGGFEFIPVKYPDLVIFTPLAPRAGQVLGEPLLRSLPAVAGVLTKIYASISTNFERIANLRYAVTYKPGAGGAENAKEIASMIAKEWSGAMAASASGAVKDFVAVGDVDIKVIGADNQMIDTEVPVRQMLEQIVAKLGIPPFMLGLHWSSTERMSTQQSDILTSELESYRRVLDSVILRICGLWMRLRGHGCPLRVIWEDINLQDELEAAKARLLAAQANKLEGGEGTE